VSDLGTLETLMQILAECSGQQRICSSLARDVQVFAIPSNDGSIFSHRVDYGFFLRPWFRNIAK
jgi:hypothetical protein